MKEKNAYGDFLNKIVKIYKRDMYVLDNQFLLPGKVSDEELVGHMICVMNIEKIKSIISDFGTTYFISDIRAAKKAMAENTENTYVSTKLLKSELESVIKTKDKLMNKISNIKSWDELIFDEETLNSIFTEGNTIELFKDDKKIPSVTIRNSVFPLLTEKTATSIFYNVYKSNNDDIWYLTFMYNTDFFQCYNIITYIDM